MKENIAPGKTRGRERSRAREADLSAVQTVKISDGLLGADATCGMRPSREDEDPIERNRGRDVVGRAQDVLERTSCLILATSR